MSEPEPIPVQAPIQPNIIQSIPKRKWYKMSPETKDTIWEIKWLLCTFITMALTQILQPILLEIMESDMKPIWKTYGSILLPSAILIGIGIINRIAQGKKKNHISQQMQQPQGMGIQQQLQGYGQQGMGYVNQGAQYGQQYMQQGAQVGTNLINTGATQLNQAIAPIVQPTPVPLVTTPTVAPTTEPKVEPTG